MRISDWSSDVCSSDLGDGHENGGRRPPLRIRREFYTTSARGKTFSRKFVEKNRGKYRRQGSWHETGAQKDGARTRPLDVSPNRAGHAGGARDPSPPIRSEEHTSELQSLMRISYAVFCLKKKKKNRQTARYNRLTEYKTHN